ncbi:hypothetical protein MXL46_05685 [Heyndrickxia sporothermodurans]|uniref:hypothetical protein n=1 Tax=Heyndrickxia sporothermodurans TaxID=46224 RepID=UPI002DB58F12|nr:hypothetical protein [Heyndrickxia sporothermodurans]MEB6548599.1 hypothetical protein [Heyndrickxia sporothermodurans]
MNVSYDYETIANGSYEWENRMEDGFWTYSYFSGENIKGIEKDRPLFVRSSESNFNLSNFMRTHLYTAFGAWRIETKKVEFTSRECVTNRNL